MGTSFDMCDVPAADAADLAFAMQTFVADGRGLLLLNGASDADLATACELLQERHRTDPQRALAAFMRFRHLVSVFGTRRLQQMLLESGYALIAPAVTVAASLRLNGRRGFNPQTFLAALTAASACQVARTEVRRDATVRETLMRLAA